MKHSLYYIILLFYGCLTGTTSKVKQGKFCKEDGQCKWWMYCNNGKCEACTKLGHICYFDNNIYCCSGTCEYIEGFYNHICRPNNNTCQTTKDCGENTSWLYSFECINNKCAMCNDPGQSCNTSRVPCCTGSHCSKDGICSAFNASHNLKIENSIIFFLSLVVYFNPSLP